MRYFSSVCTMVKLRVCDCVCVLCVCYSSRRRAVCVFKAPRCASVSVHSLRRRRATRGDGPRGPHRAPTYIRAMPVCFKAPRPLVPLGISYTPLYPTPDTAVDDCVPRPWRRPGRAGRLPRVPGKPRRMASQPLAPYSFLVLARAIYLREHPSVCLRRRALLNSILLHTY